MRKKYKNKYYKKNYLSRSFEDFLLEYKNKQITTGTFFKRMILCFGGFTGNDFRNYDLKSKKMHEIIVDYTPYCRMFKTRGNDFSPSSLILQNKYETLKFLHSKGLPTSIPRYIIKHREIFATGEDFEMLAKVETIKKGDYVIKPLNQRWGLGVWPVQ